jgi:hypothetical protein
MALLGGVGGATGIGGVGATTGIGAVGRVGGVGGVGGLGGVGMLGAGWEPVKGVLALAVSPCGSSARKSLLASSGEILP